MDFFHSLLTILFYLFVVCLFHCICPIALLFGMPCQFACHYHREWGKTAHTKSASNKCRRSSRLLIAVCARTLVATCLRASLLPVQRVTREHGILLALWNIGAYGASPSRYAHRPSQDKRKTTHAANRLYVTQCVCCHASDTRRLSPSPKSFINWTRIMP